VGLTRSMGGRRLERRLVWILGSPRSGSTWMLALLCRDRRTIPVNEPTIGVHLAVPLSNLITVEPRVANPEHMRVNEARAKLPSYFFSDRYAVAWRPKVRELILSRIGAEVADVSRERSVSDPVVAIKEPDGSQGADIIMSLLPRSRLIFLLRDGRDVIDSELDGLSEGGWMSRLVPDYLTSDRDRTAFIRARARLWLCRTHAVQRAYERHPAALRRLVRYEDLRRAPEEVLTSLVEWLDLDLDQGAIREAIRSTAFEAISPEKRGEGHFARAGTPGLWKENLSVSEQRLVEELIGSKLRELGYS
jgi:hypothetical protein